MNRRLIISTHVGKTGGNTFHAVLNRLFGFLHCIKDPTFNPHRAATPEEALEKSNRGELCFIHGHAATLKKYKPIFPDARFVSWVRHPVPRVLSNFYFRRRHMDPDEIPGSQVATLRKWIEARRSRDFVTDTWIPLERIDEFEFIGMTEHFDKHMETFFDNFADGVRVPIESHNVNPNGNNYEVDRETRDMILELNPKDLELWQIVKKRWEEGYYR